MKKNDKFSIRKYSIGVVSVIIGLFILAGANADDRVYANNESGPTSTINAGLPPISTVPEGGNPDGVDKIVDSNNDVVDKADLSKVPIPVTPGYFAIEKEVPKVASTPETVEKDYTVDFYEIGEIKYRDIKTKEIVAEKLYDNDKTNASRAAVTTLPDLPEGYEFVKQGLEREETRQVVAHELGKDPYVTDEVGIKVKLQEVNGKLAVDPNINIEADKLAPGHHLVFDVRKYIQDVERETKQVVEFVGAEGKAPKTNIQEGYKFTGKYNEKTKETTWNEKTHTYSSVDVPVVEKYFADKKQAGGREVTPEKPEVTDTVTYKHLGKILPVDEKGNSIAGSKTPQYLNDLKDPTKALETPVPELEGYVPTVKSVLPKDPGVDTKVVYKEKITDVEKGTKQVVEFVGAEGKAPKTNVQDDYKFKGKYHVVTKEIVWNEKIHAYNRVIAPKIWTNFGGLFIMKLTDENRIEMYRLKKEGYSYKELSKKFEIDPSNVKYMVKLADLHGETVLIKGKNNYYPPELKLDIINEVLILGHSIKSTSLKYALPNPALLSNWISKFKENGYNILEKPRGRTSKMKNNNKKIEKNELSKVEQLEKELEYLRAENAVLKKLREIRLKQSQTKKKQK